MIRASSVLGGAMTMRVVSMPATVTVSWAEAACVKIANGDASATVPANNKAFSIVIKYSVPGSGAGKGRRDREDSALLPQICILLSPQNLTLTIPRDFVSSVCGLGATNAPSASRQVLGGV